MEEVDYYPTMDMVDQLEIEINYYYNLVVNEGVNNGIQGLIEKKIDALLLNIDIPGMGVGSDPSATVDVDVVNDDDVKAYYGFLSFNISRV